MQTSDFLRFSYYQAIRSRSDLPGVEAFDEEPLENHLLSQLNIVMR